jgi:hypothetical protein
LCAGASASQVLLLVFSVEGFQAKLWGYKLSARLKGMIHPGWTIKHPQKMQIFRTFQFEFWGIEDLDIFGLSFWGYFLVDCQKKSTIFRDRKRSVLKFGVLWGDSEGQTSVVA